jgi:hypothetical protein
MKTKINNPILQFEYPKLYPRVAALRDILLDHLEKWPNQNHNQSARTRLEAMVFPELLRTYMNWAYRIIPPRKRQVSYGPSFWSPLAQQHLVAIAQMVGSIENGESLYPFHSKHPFTNPAFVAERGQSKGTAWNRTKGKFDKDSVLNAYGLHHLHLGEIKNEKDEFCTRTQNVLFVYFTRNTAELVYLGSHNFHSEGLRNAVARWKEWRGEALSGLTAPTGGLTAPPDLDSHDDQVAVENAGGSTLKVVGDQYVVVAEQTFSGDSPQVIEHMQQVLRVLFKADPKLDDEEWVFKTFESAPNKIPVGSVLSWKFSGMDLGLVERESRQYALLVRGPI